jgi:branched-chain amino acid transport system substrate-binding protein
MVFILVSVMMIITVGCQSKTAPPPAGQTAVEKVEEKGPWKIGFIAPLSGPVSSMANYTLEAIQIAVKQINDAGGIHGRPLEVIVEDDQTNPTMTIAAAKKLIERDNVIVLNGPLLTTFSLAAIPVVEEEKIANLTHGAGREIVEPTKKWVFKLPHTDTLIIRAQLEFLSKIKGAKNIAVFHQDDASGMSGGQQLQTLAGEYGIKVVAVEKFAAADTDMKPQLLRINRTNAEAVAIVGSAGAVGVIAKNAREVNVKIPMIGSHGAVSHKFINVAGNAAEGMYFIGPKSVAGTHLNDNDPFKKGYDKLMGDLKKEFDIFHGNGYDSIYLIAEALKIAGPDADRNKVRDAFESIKNFTLVNATYTFTSDNHDGPQADSLIPLVVKDGKFIPAKN